MIKSFANSLPRGSFYLKLEPAPAWTAILALVIFTSVCLLGGAGGILRLAFPVGAFAVGLFLYVRYPVLYVSFSWWIWFLTPFIRRVADYQSGWVEPSPILLAPFMVSSVTLDTLLRHLPRSYHQGGLPFIMAFVSVFYGFLIGLVRNSPVVAARALVDWMTPLLVGFYLFVHWRDYPRFKRTIQHTFLWGVLVCGTYGVVQYLVAPAWDCFWIIQTELVTFGSPEPLGIRVFSTMNSPGPFGVVMMTGLLLLFSSESSLRIPAAVGGYLAFLLSLVRSAWGGWLVGFLTIISSVKVAMQIRLLVTILVMIMCVLPLTTTEPFAENINSRFETVIDIQDDKSFNDRSENYSKNVEIALSNFLGNGIGNVYFINEKGALEQLVVDSGFLDLFFTLGWFGAIPYICGMVLCVLSLFVGSESRFDTFAGAARAIVLSIFAQLIFTSVMLAVSGVVLWSFIGMGMAARKYYSWRRFHEVPRR